MLCSTITTVMSSSRMRRTVVDELLDLGVREARGRFVEEQQPGLHEQRAAQLDALVQAVRQLVGGQLARPSRGRCGRGDRAPPARSAFSARTVRGSRSDHSTGPPGRRVWAPRSTFSSTVSCSCSAGCWNVRASPWLRERGRARPAHLDVVDRDRAGARPVVPADAVEQRGLAGAVGPDEAEDLARLDRERHVLQHLDAAEAKAHVLQDCS